MADPYKMLSEKFGTSSSSSSSNAAMPPIPFSISLLPAEASSSLPASSSSAMPGPNTVDMVKSSSMAPVVNEQKKPDSTKKSNNKKFL